LVRQSPRNFGKKLTVLMAKPFDAPKLAAALAAPTGRSLGNRP